jgi:dolichol-phosphate mannosyltransferase
LVYENSFFTVLENPNCLAPGFLARNYVSTPKDSYAYSAADLGLIRLYFLPVELTGVEMNDPNLAGTMNPQNGEVELTAAFRDREGDPFRVLDGSLVRREGPNRIRIQLPGDSFWVTVTQAWHPDWKVFVDGRGAELVRVTLALPGFRCSPEAKEAVLSFEPPFWVSGVLSLGLLGWLGSLGGVAFLRFGPAPKAWKKWWDGEELELEIAETKTTSKKSDPKGQGSAAKIQKFLVIMPTYNEAETIQQVLEEVQAKASGAEILVVDDNSPDGTAGKVKEVPSFGKKVHLMERPGKNGLGSAYKEGFQWALKRGYDAVVEMDADLSHDPADIPKLLQALNDGADIAVGSRYLNGVRVLNWPQSRLWVSSFGGWYARWLTGLPMTDPTSGFKAIRRRVLEGMDWEKFTAQGYGFQIEIHFLAWQAGFKVHEIPIVFTERREGQSKMSLQIAQEAAWRVLQLAFRRVFP